MPCDDVKMYICIWCTSLNHSSHGNSIWSAWNIYTDVKQNAFALFVLRFERVRVRNRWGIFRNWIDRKCYKDHFVFNHYAILFFRSTMWCCHIFRLNLLDAYLTVMHSIECEIFSLCIKIKWSCRVGSMFFSRYIFK